MTRVTPVEFRALFDGVTRSAWRLETQFVYREPNEREPLHRFLSGEPDDLSWFTGWLDRIRLATAGGIRFGRVRVLSDPLTDYLRFELSITPPAVQAGEDIRVLPAHRARELGLPAEDFWLFDDERVALMDFGEHGVTGAEIITDPAEVARYRDVRDLALSAAVPYNQWSTSAR
jgi:hypothetical protein